MKVENKNEQLSYQLSQVTVGNAEIVVGNLLVLK